VVVFDVLWAPSILTRGYTLEGAEYALTMAAVGALVGYVLELALDFPPPFWRAWVNHRQA
jgi:hypothetical protein